MNQHHVDVKHVREFQQCSVTILVFVKKGCNG